MPKKKKKKTAQTEPVIVSEESKTAVINFGDRTLTIRISDYDVKGKVTLKTGEDFYFSGSLM